MNGMCCQEDSEASVEGLFSKDAGPGIYAFAG